MEFAGTADAVLDIQFDRENQRVIGKVRATSVNLSGTGGIGSSLIARLVQGSIDKSLNPLEKVASERALPSSWLSSGQSLFDLLIRSTFLMHSTVAAS